MASCFDKIVIEVIGAVTQTLEWRGAQTIITRGFFRITKDPLHRIYQIQGFQKFREFKESEPNQKQYLGLRLVSADGRK